MDGRTVGNPALLARRPARISLRGPSSERRPKERLVSAVEHPLDLRPRWRFAHDDQTARPGLPRSFEGRGELRVQIAALWQVAGLELALDESAQSRPIGGRQTTCLVVEIERIAVEPALQERTDLLSHPLNSGEDRQTNQAWPPRGEPDVPRDADLHKLRRKERWLAPADLEPDVHRAEAGERPHLYEWVLQALRTRIHDADVG